MCVDGHDAHHLAAEGDGGDVAGSDIRLSEQGARGRANGLPPLDRVLLGPTGLRIGDGVGGKVAGNQSTGFIKQAWLYYRLYPDRGLISRAWRRLTGQFGGCAASIA